MSNTRSCEDVIKEDITPADFGIAESEHQKAIYFAEYMLHRCVVNMQAEIERLKAQRDDAASCLTIALHDCGHKNTELGELRAKLRALESIDKNAAGWIRIVQGHTSFVVAETEWGPDKPDRPGVWLPLYTATGAKHD